MSEKQSGRRLRSASVTTVVSISLVLLMLGLLGMLLLYSKKISNYVKENISFEVFLKDEATDADIASFKHSLDAAPYMLSSKYTSKQQADSIMRHEVGKTDSIDILGYIPFPASVKIWLKADYANNDSIAKIKKEITANKNIVRDFKYVESLVSSVNENFTKISLVILAFAALLMVVALALINNTIRLAIYSKRFSIKTMQLVGATGGFIMRPFLLTGIRQGIFAAFIAIGMIYGISVFGQRSIAELHALQDERYMFILFGIVLALGMFISFISTWLAVRKYLYLRSDELYY